MEWVASTLHTTSEHGVSSITTADAHASTASSRLNRRPPADLNGLVLFAERRNLVSARVPSHFKRGQTCYFRTVTLCTFIPNVVSEVTQRVLYQIQFLVYYVMLVSYRRCSSM
jgi:hypothetical protein